MNAEQLGEYGRGITTIRFMTESGSIYKLDTDAMTWERTYKANASGSIRQENGELRSVPEVEIGKEVTIHDSKVLPGFDAHVVMTSPVVSIFLNGAGE